jgi:hypothetical protein
MIIGVWSVIHGVSSDDAAEDFADNPTSLRWSPTIYRKRPWSADKGLWSLFFCLVCPEKRARKEKMSRLTGGSWVKWEV